MQKGQDWKEFNCQGLDWKGWDWKGLDWKGSDWKGLDWKDLDQDQDQDWIGKAHLKKLK